MARDPRNVFAAGNFGSILSVDRPRLSVLSAHAHMSFPRDMGVCRCYQSSTIFPEDPLCMVSKPR